LVAHSPQVCDSTKNPTCIFRRRLAVSTISLTTSHPPNCSSPSASFSPIAYVFKGPAIWLIRPVGSLVEVATKSSCVTFVKKRSLRFATSRTFGSPSPLL
jgi:hypothetical protein